MKKIMLAISLILFIESAYSQDSTLVWSDEFDQDSININNWNFETGNGNYGWGNNEKQYYTKRPENIKIVNGVLVITARKESYNGYNYTSSRIQTKNKAYFKYGRIEMKAKLPRGKGTWPAFWMLPQSQLYGSNYWPDNGELDIMEYVGYDPSKVHGTVHTNKNSGSASISSVITYYGVENNFHVYAVEWAPTIIKFYVDSYLYGTYSRMDRNWQYWPFDQNFFMLINFAVGGNWGGAQGIDDTVFPQTFEIDYVRVYQYTNTGTASVITSDEDISVSPNPVRDILTVKINESLLNKSWVSVFNLSGTRIHSPLLCTNESTGIDFSQEKTGCYILLVEGNNMKKTYPVIKN